MGTLFFFGWFKDSVTGRSRLADAGMNLLSDGPKFRDPCETPTRLRQKNQNMNTALIDQVDCFRTRPKTIGAFGREPVRKADANCSGWRTLHRPRSSTLDPLDRRWNVSVLITDSTTL
jgi:hypothetical protein